MTDIALPPEEALSLFPEPVRQFHIKLWGEVDIARVAELHHLVEDYLACPALDIVIDVGEVTFMDSTGLGFMARLYHAAKDRGGSITVSHAQREVERVIRMTGLEHILLIEAEH